MSQFIVSARKYRPTQFQDVVGQQQVTSTLEHAITNDQLAHAYLFCGPRGVGKTTCARILARVINEQNSDINPEDNTSLNIYELDAASNNSVDDIRALTEQVRFAPQSGKYKVYIIDEVHMLSPAAFNAFLKTLEEPPSYAIFILATTEKHKIIPTILSRCQVFDFKRIQANDTADYLAGICKKENIPFELEALQVIAEKADGALRDALSIFDRVHSYKGNINYADAIDILNVLDFDYYFKAVDAITAQDTAALLNLFDSILKNGFDGDTFLLGLSNHLRNLMVCKDPATIQLLDTTDKLKDRYLQQAQSTSINIIINGLHLLNEADSKYKTSKNKRLTIELALIKIAYIPALTKEIPTTSEEKKKPLTEPSEKPSTPTKKTENTTFANKPEHTITSSTKAENTSPSSKFANPSRLSSLEEIEKQLLSDEATLHADQQKESFSLSIKQEELDAIFNEAVNKLNKQSKVSIATTLQQSRKVIKDGIIHITAGSAFHCEQLKNDRDAIAQVLKELLDTPMLELDFSFEKIESLETNTNKLYTSSDKLKRMAEKNPTIIELKNRLDLNLEY